MKPLEISRTASAGAAEALEPEAARLMGNHLLVETAAVSQAISAKRQADMLERIALTLDRMAEPVLIDGGPIELPLGMTP